MKGAQDFDQARCKIPKRVDVGEGYGRGRGGTPTVGKQRPLQESHDLPSKLQVRTLMGHHSLCYQYATGRAAVRAPAVRIRLGGGTAKQDEGIIKLPTKNGAGGRAGYTYTLPTAVCPNKV